MTRLSTSEYSASNIVFLLLRLTPFFQAERTIVYHFIMGVDQNIVKHHIDLDDSRCQKSWNTLFSVDNCAGKNNNYWVDEKLLRSMSALLVKANCPTSVRHLKDKGRF